MGIIFGNEVFQNKDKAIGYYSSCLWAATDSLRSYLKSEAMVAIHGYEDLWVETEYPSKEKMYPYIQVMYRNREFRPASLNEWSSVKSKDENGNEVYRDVATYLYKGEILLSVYALSPIEAAKIADSCIAGLGINPAYKNLLISNPYINIHPNMKTLKETSSNDSIGTPFDENQVQVWKMFSFDVMGEFYYVNKTEPVFISRFDFTANIASEEEVHWTLEQEKDELWRKENTIAP